MNDNEPTGMRTRMMAEQAVARMDGRLRWRMDADAREGLVEAIIQTGAPDKFLFRPEPFHPAPPRWSLSGMLARALVKANYWRAASENTENDGELLSAAHYKVKRSGAVGLIVILLVALLVGISGVGKPFELAFQIGRDAARQMPASGDIVVIAKDDQSAKMFGGIPWKRRYDAQLVDRLREMGAKRIIFNQVMADSFDPNEDRLLANAFDRAHGKVWLSVMQTVNPNTGQVESVLPTPMFRDRVNLSHIWRYYNVFNNVEKDFGTRTIGGQLYPSQAAVLAGNEGDVGQFRIDYAIDHTTIPTISASDIVLGKIDRSSIVGKTVIIGITAETAVVRSSVLGQGWVSSAHGLVIAAETIKAGVAYELGYFVPFLICLLICLACVLNDQQKRRSVILISGTAGLLLIMLIGDRLRLHLEVVPALLVLITVSIRESTRSKIISAMTTNELTGLPNLAHLKFVKGYQKSAVVGVKIKRYDQFIAKRPRDEQRMLLRSIVARINVMAPDCVVHQGEKGLFIFLIPSDSGINLDVLPGQLHALFTQDFATPQGMQRIDISVGTNDDMNDAFDVRLAVAKDRTLLSEFVTLQAVQ
jgi:diguanylate cyclase